MAQGTARSGAEADAPERSPTGPAQLGGAPPRAAPRRHGGGRTPKRELKAQSDACRVRVLQSSLSVLVVTLLLLEAGRGAAATVTGPSEGDFPSRHVPDAVGNAGDEIDDATATVGAAAMGPHAAREDVEQDVWFPDGLLMLVLIVKDEATSIEVGALHGWNILIIRTHSLPFSLLNLCPPVPSSAHSQCLIMTAPVVDCASVSWSFVVLILYNPSHCYDSSFLSFF